MNVKLEAEPTAQLLGVARFQCGAVWAEVTRDRAHTINPRNFVVTASHGIPTRLREALARKDSRACFGSGTIYNVDKASAVALARMLVREGVKSFGVRAY